MSDQLFEIVSKLNYNDLKTLEKDLSMGASLFKSLLKKKIKEIESDCRTCAVCGGSLSESENVFNLVFGPDRFKKKASFCAIDCMGYFIERLKEIKNKRKEGLKSAIKSS